MMTHTHTPISSLRFFFSPMLIALQNPRANSGSKVRWRWHCSYREKGKRESLLPLTLMSVPGSTRIWSTVSTWFLLHALWRRVSPSTRTHNGQAQPRERRGGREERNPKLGCVRCPAHCPLLYGEQTNKIPQKCPQTPKKKKAWPKKVRPANEDAI